MDKLTLATIGVSARDHMVGQCCCPNCEVPTPIEQTDGTRCMSCGLQMSEIKPAPVVLSGIERELADARR